MSKVDNEGRTGLHAIDFDVFAFLRITFGYGFWNSAACLEKWAPIPFVEMGIWMQLLLVHCCDHCRPLYI